MRRMRFLWAGTLGFALGAAAIAMAACGGAESDKPTIIFSDLDWETAQIQNAIARRIIESGYGYETDSVFGATIPLLQALSAGDTNVTMEIWLPNAREAWDEALSQGGVEAVGKSLANNWQSAFTIPQYVADANPGLRSVEDLKKPQYRDLFVTPDSDGKARLVNCITGWECERVNSLKVESYGLSDHVKPMNPGSYAALAAEIESGFRRKEPILFYLWGPTTITQRIDAQHGGAYFLEEPPYTDECWATDKRCAYPIAEILIAVRSELKESAPDVVAFLSKWNFSVPNQLAAEGYLEESGADYPGVADWFLRNTDDWKNWVPADVAAKTLAAL